MEREDVKIMEAFEIEAPTLYLVIPCYNEEETLKEMSKVFEDKLRDLMVLSKISYGSRIMYIDDGSDDNTWEYIKKLSNKHNSCVIGIKQSKNRGHQASLLAGLMESIGKCDISISMDCDGQDDINVIDKMLEEYDKGNEIVYGVRSDRSTDSKFKSTTALMYYTILKLFGVESVYNHADCRLLSNKVLKALSEYDERDIYLRGIIPTIGYQSSEVYYKRKKREVGESKYTISKMFKLAKSGIISNTTVPMRIIEFIGIIMSLLGLVNLIYMLCDKEIDIIYLICWTLCVIGGITNISIGILGEYIGLIVKEVKHRPRYIISERVGFDKIRKSNEL